MAGYGDPNSAMAGYNQQMPMMGAPAPMYSPFGYGNPSIDTAFAMYGAPMLQQFLGADKFLPQQFPSQNIMDQMVAAKYQRSSLANLDKAREIDKGSIHSSLRNLRSKYTDEPLSALGNEQLKNTAGYINNPAVQMLASTAIGAQNAEDLFFGRRGSAVQLASAVNQIGFYRPDSVTGGDRMTGKSLEVFSNQLYSNLYGPDADLNDVSGFSAGRAGTVMSELGQRGLLPQSFSKLSAQERRREMFTRDSSGKEELNSDIKKLGLSDDVIKAINQNSPAEELTKIEGGADAIRKIDATRVGNSLKQYTQALASVREIFGANGITNAPMQQLMAAMDALTQNSGSSMAPGKIENLMRRTQMASSDAGVSLESLMGLSARSGAMAEQYGLSRGIAAESVVSAMETGRALRDTGGFKPGFGRLDPTKAVLFSLDQNMRVEASRAGQYSGALARIVAENSSNKNFNGKNMRAMVAALQSGASSYYDETLKRTVNIQEELGRNPDQFASRLTEEAGISRAQFSAYVRDPASQEFQSSVAGSLGAGAQAADLKNRLGNRLAFNTDLSSRINGNFTAEQRTAIAEGIGGGLSNALIDQVNTTMTPEERINILQSTFEQSVINDVKRRNPGMAPDAVMTEAKKLYQAGDSNVLGLKTQDDLRNYLAQMQAEASIITKGETGLDLATAQQQMNSRVVDETGRRRGMNINRAGINNAMRLGDGSNLMQRFSDMLGGTSNDPVIDQLFGVVNSMADRDKLVDGLAGGKAGLEKSFKSMQAAYGAATLNTEQEKEDVISTTTAANFDERKKRFDGTAVEETLKSKTKYLSTADLSKELAGKASEQNTRAYKLAYGKATGATPDDIEQLFKDPKKAYAAMAATPGMLEKIGLEGVDLGIGGDTITEADWGKVVMSNDMFKAAPTKEIAEKFKAMGMFSQELDYGTITSKTLLGALGHSAVVDNEALNNSVTAVIKGAKEGNPEQLRKDLGTAGIVGEQAEHVVNMAQFSRTLNAMGGFKALGVENAGKMAQAAGRKTSLESAVKAGRVTGGVADLIKKQQAGEKLTEDESKQLNAAFENEGSYNAALNDLNVADGAKNAKGDAYKNKKDALDDIRKTSDSLAGDATAAKDPTGIGASIASAVSAPIASAVKEAFGGEVKLENVTVGNLNIDFQKLLGSIADASSNSANATKSTGPVTLEGTLSLKNLNTVLAQLLATPSIEPTPADNANVVANMV